MKQIIGILCLVLVALVVLVNAAPMVISPRSWFRMPRWIRLSGSLSETKYASGWGAIQIRLLGACFLAIMAWFLHGCFSISPR